CSIHMKWAYCPASHAHVDCAMNAEPEALRCLKRAVGLRASTPRWPGRLKISKRLSPSCATGESYSRSTTCPGFEQLTALRRSLAIIRRTAELASEPPGSTIVRETCSRWARH